jgi:hypothetical protein
MSVDVLRVRAMRRDTRSGNPGFGDYNGEESQRFSRTILEATAELVASELEMLAGFLVL